MEEQTNITESSSEMNAVITDDILVAQDAWENIPNAYVIYRGVVYGRRNDVQMDSMDSEDQSYTVDSDSDD